MRLAVIIFAVLLAVNPVYAYMKIMGEPVNAQQMVSLPVVPVDMNNLSQYESLEDNQHGIKLFKIKTGIILGIYNITLPFMLEELNEAAIALANTKWSIKNFINATAISGEPIYILMFAVPQPPTNIIVE